MIYIYISYRYYSFRIKQKAIPDRDAPPMLIIGSTLISSKLRCGSCRYGSTMEHQSTHRNAHYESVKVLWESRI